MHDWGNILIEIVPKYFVQKVGIGSNIIVIICNMYIIYYRVVVIYFIKPILGIACIRAILEILA